MGLARHLCGGDVGRRRVEAHCHLRGPRPRGGRGGHLRLQVSRGEGEDRVPLWLTEVPRRHELASGLVKYTSRLGLPSRGGEGSGSRAKWRGYVDYLPRPPCRVDTCFV